MKGIVWTTESLSNAIGVEFSSNFTLGKIEFNSKNIVPGDIFIALSGGERDGHEFVLDAIERGAALAICSKKIDSDKVVYVHDTFKALIQLAKYKRETSLAKYIGVTGSVGKTSTKEAIGSILSSFSPTFINQGSFNNHLGVPLSLASVPTDAVYSINEMGMNHVGEIRELTNLARPDIAVITRIAEVHLEFLGSLENICKAKCEIFEGLRTGGTAIINSDSSYYDLQLKILKELNIKEIYSFGENAGSNCYVVDYQKQDSHNLVTYNIMGKLYKTKNHLIGKHQAVNIASALLVAKTLGLDLEKAALAVENIAAYYGRGVEVKIDINGNIITLIDDAYNANPTSVKAALASLSERTGKKVAILADMGELGESEVLLHRSLAKPILEAGVTQLFTVGNLMKNLYEELKTSIEVIHYKTAEEKTFADIMSRIKEDSATILVKGSNSTLIRNFVYYAKSKDIRSGGQRNIHCRHSENVLRSRAPSE